MPGKARPTSVQSPAKPSTTPDGGTEDGYPRGAPCEDDGSDDGEDHRKGKVASQEKIGNIRKKDYA